MCLQSLILNHRTRQIILLLTAGTTHNEWQCCGTSQDVPFADGTTNEQSDLHLRNVEEDMMNAPNVLKRTTSRSTMAQHPPSHAYPHLLRPRCASSSLHQASIISPYFNFS